jgi:hypothetical protein
LRRIAARRRSTPCCDAFPQRTRLFVVFPFSLFFLLSLGSFVCVLRPSLSVRRLSFSTLSPPHSRHTHTRAARALLCAARPKLLWFPPRNCSASRRGGLCPVKSRLPPRLLIKTPFAFCSSAEWRFAGYWTRNSQEHAHVLGTKRLAVLSFQGSGLQPHAVVEPSRVRMFSAQELDAAVAAARSIVPFIMGSHAAHKGLLGGAATAAAGPFATATQHLGLASAFDPTRAAPDALGVAAIMERMAPLPALQSLGLAPSLGLFPGVDFAWMLPRSSGFPVGPLPMTAMPIQQHSLAAPSTQPAPLAAPAAAVAAELRSGSSGSQSGGDSAPEPRRDSRQPAATVAAKSDASAAPPALAAHDTARPLKCRLCGKRFAKKPRLRAHERLHSGARPYPCRVTGCEVRFADSSNRRRHEDTHRVKACG